MKNSSKKSIGDIYELKKNVSPVNGVNTYSVFKNGLLVFMMDGDRASLFIPEDIELILAHEDSEVRVYRVGNYAFTGSLELTQDVMKMVPKGCVVCSEVDKMVEL